MRELRTITRPDGYLGIGSLPKGTHKLYICLNGRPVSPACSVRVEG